MAEQTTRDPYGVRESVRVSPSRKPKREQVEFLRRLDAFREKVFAEHGPFEDSVKILATMRESRYRG